MLILTRTLIAAALLFACGNMSLGQDPTLTIYKTLIEQDQADYRGATPKVIDFLKNKDQAIALQAVEILEVIGKKLDDSDLKGDKELRLSATKALLKASLDTRREKLAPAAKKAAEKISTKKERETLLAEIKEREDEKKKDKENDKN